MVVVIVMVIVAVLIVILLQQYLKIVRMKLNSSSNSNRRILKMKILYKVNILSNYWSYNKSIISREHHKEIKMRISWINRVINKIQFKRSNSNNKKVLEDNKHIINKLKVLVKSLINMTIII